MPRPRLLKQNPFHGREVAFADAKGASGAFRVLCTANLVSLRSWNHSHVFDRFWRVYYNFTPGAYIEHNREKILLGPSRFVIVPANVLFETFLRVPQVNHFYLHFTIDSNYVFPSDHPIVLRVDFGAKNQVKDIARSLIQKELNRTFIHQRSLALLHYLFASVLGEASFNSIMRPEIAKAIRELEGNPTAFSSVAQMAAFAGMSNRNFQRHFQQSMRKAPLLYLNEARLREAARRLIHSNETIDEIAFALGFANRFHFSRLFRLFLGTPPAAFRRSRLVAEHQS